MGTLIDSSVLIDLERGGLALDSAIAVQESDAVAIAAVTASELLHGAYRSTTVSQRQRRERFVERLLAALPVLPFDLLTARIHASLSAGLAAKGTKVGAHDLLIAATAISNGYRVLTRDRRSFPRIPGLEVVVL